MTHDAVNTLRGILRHPLNRNQRLRALARFARWQVASRLGSAPRVHEWVGGTRFYVRRGEVGLTGNIYDGLHEANDMGFVLHALGPGEVFVDAGANSGSYTILASGARSARTYAFEPVPATFERLSRNVALNDLQDRVVARNAGLGDAPGRIMFHVDALDTNSRVLPPGSPEKGLEVEVTTLDEAVGHEPVAVVKIDVEGYELPVLRGASRVLSSPNLAALLVETNEAAHAYGFGEDQVLALLAERGFRPHRYDLRSRELAAIEGVSRTDNNTLFVRDADAVRRKLKAAPRIDVNGWAL